MSAHSEPFVGSDDYELIEAAVMETARGRWFLAEHARRQREEERQRLMTAIQQLERVAQENFELARFHAVAEELSRKLDDILLSMRGVDDVPDPDQRHAIEQRLIEPRPFLK